jgi:hypothetical protein
MDRDEKGFKGNLRTNQEDHMATDKPLILFFRVSGAKTKTKTSDGGMHRVSSYPPLRLSFISYVFNVFNEPREMNRNEKEFKGNLLTSPSASISR